MYSHYHSFHVWIKGGVEEGQLAGFSGEEEGFRVGEGGEPEGEAMFTAVEDVAGSHCCFFCG